MKSFTTINDIDPNEEDIYVDDLMLKKLDSRRKRKYSADKSLINMNPFALDINNIKDIPDGRIRIDIENARFECFFHRGKSKKMYIILDGARTRNGG